MVETLQRLDLRLDKFLELLVAVQNFNRISSAGVILGQFDLAADSAAEGPSKCVLIQSSWHSFT